MKQKTELFMITALITISSFTLKANAETHLSCSANIENSTTQVVVDQRNDHYGKRLLSIDVYENGHLAATDAPVKETPLILGEGFEGKRFVLRIVRQSRNAGAFFSDKTNRIPSFECN